MFALLILRSVSFSKLLGSYQGGFQSNSIKKVTYIILWIVALPTAEHIKSYVEWLEFVIDKRMEVKIYTQFIVYNSGQIFKAISCYVLTIFFSTYKV
jgi:hypothetical protein